MTTVDSSGTPGPGPDAAAPGSGVEIVGDATPEQVAALLTVLSALGDETPPEPRRRSAWAAYDAAVRRPLHPGTGAWSLSLRHR